MGSNAIHPTTGQGPLTAVKNFFTKTPARMVVTLSIAMYLITGIFKPLSINQTAIVNIIMLTVLLSIACAGQTLVLISGGLDFSVGAVMSSAAIITAYVMRGQEGHFLQVLFLSLAVGALVGLLNGVCSVKIGLPAMIVTMAISSVVSRMQYVFTQGSVTGYPAKGFITTVIGKQLGGWIPNILFYALLIYPIVFFLLNFSRFGRQLFLVGNNPIAANLSGVKVNKVKILAYVFSGMLSAFAGMLGAAYKGSAACDVFNDYSFTALVAVIVGGTSFDGGVGSFTGSIAGALLMTVISNTLTIFNLSQPMRNLINGLVMVLLLVTYNRKKSVRQ